MPDSRESAQPFYGLQPPGQDGARAPLRTVEALAAYFVREMRGIQPHGPYYLGGSRRWTEMRRELFTTWARRAQIRWRRMLGRRLSQESLYFDFLTSAFAARRRYRPLPYPRPITLFRVPAQPSNEIYATDPLLGWGGLAAGGLEVVDIEGFHGQPMFREPYVRGLAQELRARLRAAQASAGGATKHPASEPMGPSGNPSLPIGG